MTTAKIKSYYETGKWTLAQVQALLEKGIITEAQYAEIVGESDA